VTEAIQTAARVNCPDCPETFPSMPAYEEHWQRVHGATLLEKSYDSGNKAFDDLLAERDQCFYSRGDVDHDHIISVATTAVSAVDIDGDPLWLMLIGAPGGSKTETIETLGSGDEATSTADAHLSDLTVAGLLSQTKEKNPKRTGVLSRLPNDGGLITITDMSPLLSREQISGKEQNGTFAAMREIFGGKYDREMHPRKVSWRGRVTFVGAVTSAIDRHGHFINEMGPRFLFIRLTPYSDEDREHVLDLVYSRQNYDGWKARQVEMMREVVMAGRERLRAGIETPEEYRVLVRHSATLIAMGRVTVPRDAYRDQAIIGLSETEEATRATAQLTKYVRASVALGWKPEIVERNIRHIAWSSMKRERAAVLNVLRVAQDSPTSEEIGARAGMSRKVAQTVLEDLSCTGLIQDLQAGPGQDHVWQLDRERAARILGW
jgi:hypothetical protein